MAFQQPTRQVVQRVSRPVAQEQAGASSQTRVGEQAVEESQTWVLFSPPTEASTTSYLSETDHSLDTPGRPRLSDLDSLNTIGRSSQATHIRPSEASSAVDGLSVEEDAELDSLDSHLPEFRSIPEEHVPSYRGTHNALPVFPAHDGLGSFHLDRPAIGRDAQDQIFQFEKFNPHKQRRTMDGVDQAQVDSQYSQLHEDEKRQRIEAWRLEHSRVLLDEVQRETRRRRRSLASASRHQHTDDTEVDNMTWHDEDAVEDETKDRGFLARMTRTVVKDILGIDDRLLEILLGESVVDTDDLSSTPRASRLNDTQLQPQSPLEQTWQLRVLETVSRELGRLVNSLSHHHPGAFSTYHRMQQMPLRYAGLPVIPESADAPSVALGTKDTSSHPSQPEFRPTMGRTSSAVDIPVKTAEECQEHTSMGNAFTKEEWEKELDIKLVFRYLISKFSSRSSNSSSSSYLPSNATQDAAARAARVRQHHPLIARSRPMERRPFKVAAPGSPVATRRHSSCASQSTKRSARRSSCSSRHYWDIGGSLGTGSRIATNGPMGSWGEL